MNADNEVFKQKQQFVWVLISKIFRIFDIRERIVSCT